MEIWDFFVQDWCKAPLKANSLFLPSLKLHCRDEYHRYINMFFQVSHHDTCQWKHAVSVITSKDRCWSNHFIRNLTLDSSGPKSVKHLLSHTEIMAKGVLPTTVIKV